jgi:hypothetical protein
MLGADALHPKIEVEEGLEHSAYEPVDGEADAPILRATLEPAEMLAFGRLAAPHGRYEGDPIHRLGYTADARLVTVAQTVAIDRSRTLRGAVAGALAAGVWAAQVPLDRRVFGCDYDDVELLGKAVTRGPAWPVVGVALHVQNGALFGAAYANLAPRLPLPSWARGPFVALLEHAVTWPLTAASDRLHPARDELPKAFGSGRALAQATWRHMLFGVVLGELERRLNAEEAVEIPDYEEIISSNGHGNLEHAATAS